MTEGEDWRQLAARIADVSHDIDPELARQRARFADFQVRPPSDVPPRWQRALYWASLWRLSAGYRDWAEWEQRHSRNYTLARVIARLTIMILVSALTLALASDLQRRLLIGYAVLYLVVEVTSGLRRIGQRGIGDRLRVAAPGQSNRALALDNTRRLLAFAAACAVAVVLPHLLPTTSG